MKRIASIFVEGCSSCPNNGEGHWRGAICMITQRPINNGMDEKTFIDPSCPLPLASDVLPIRNEI